MNAFSHQCLDRFKQVQSLVSGGRLSEAAIACSRLCEQFPTFAPGWELGSRIALGFGNGNKALEYIERAVLLDIEQPLWRIRQAKVLCAMRRMADARQVLEAVERFPPESLQGHRLVIDELAHLYTLLERHEDALRCYRKLTGIDPGNAGNFFNLANTERFLGHAEQAEQAYDRGLMLDPMNGEACYLRSSIRKQTPQRNHIDTLVRVLGRMQESDWMARSQVLFALAKEHDDLGDHPQSFDCLRRGADLRRRNMEYDVATDVAAIDRVRSTYSRAVLDGIEEGRCTAAPIFVVGLPRSGTTLVERILASHPQTVSAGERNDFSIELECAIQPLLQGQSVARDERIAASTVIDFDGLGRSYVRAVSEAVAADGRRFIDKMPLNYLYCGLIAKALPNACIIEVVRHPLDSCYALYKQWFTRAYPFSYDLEEVACYYLAYLRLMNHWHEVMPGRVLRLRYEDLVDDQQGQTRRLLDHCGLAWDASCLDFHRNPAASTTASAMQVRGKIYRSAMGNWRHYAEPLLPVSNRVAAASEYRESRLGYLLA
ncbi:MAG: sulfotransferase [Pseudomonas sp.]